MTAYDLVISWIRTGVAAGVGSFIAWLALRGFDLDPSAATAVTLAVGGAFVTVYQVVVSSLQRRWPIVGVLLGSTRAPSYTAPSAPIERTGPRAL